MSVVDSPVQIIESPPIDITGNAYTSSRCTAVSAQPLTSVPITEYRKDTDGETEVCAPVKFPGCHTYDIAPDAVRVLDSPMHKDVSPEINTVGGELTLTFTESNPIQPN